MNNVKKELVELIEKTMIPESEAYLKELHLLLENKTATEDDIEAIRDMESFLVELENILLAIEESKLTDNEILDVYEKISLMIQEHE